jgi:peptide/nickel transport system substrate-binding protein
MDFIQTRYKRLKDFFTTLSKKISRRTHFELKQKLDQEFVFKVLGSKKVPTLKQLKYIKKFYNKTEVRITNIASLVMVVAVIALAIGIYKTHVVLQPATGGEHVEAVIGAPTYINPLFAQTNDIDQDLSRLIFSSLMRLDERGQLTGDLAQSYEIDEQQTTYTITLKPDIKWHDGESLTANDVLFTVQSIQDQSFKSPLYVTFRNVQVRKIDERTMSFTLPEPFAPFLSVLTFGILPEHLWLEVEPSHAILAELNTKPVGSGPYKFSELAKNKSGNILSYTLERFKNYHATGPFIKTITLKFFSSFEEAYESLKQGNVDSIGFLPRQNLAQIQELAEQSRFQSYQFSLPQYTALFFNQDSNPVLAEANVRRALALATSKQQVISKAFSGIAHPVNAPILPGMVGYSQEIPTLLFDAALAEKILDDAGWKRVYPESDDDVENNPHVTSGSNNLGLNDDAREIYTREKTIKSKVTTLEITLTTIQQDQMIQVAETIRELWQKVGVKVNVQIVEIGKIQKEVIKPRAYELLLFGQILGRDPDPYPFWHSSQSNDPGLNLALYNNKKVDELLEDARRTTNEALREEKYVAFQELLVEDLPAIFLYSVEYIYIIPQKIRGIATERINHPSDRFSSAASWYIKTKKRLQF